MKGKLLFFLFLFLTLLVDAQHNEIDSLRNIIRRQQRDSSEVNAAVEIAWRYVFINPDSAIIMAKEARDLAKEMKSPEMECEALNALGEASHTTGDFPQALEALFNALRIGRELKDKEKEASSLDFIGIAYVDLGEYRTGLNYLYEAKSINDKSSVKTAKFMTSFRLSNIGHAYEKLGMRDSALFFQEQAKAVSKDSLQGPETSLILGRLGVVQADFGNSAGAMRYYKKAIQIGDLLNIGIAEYRLAELFYTLNQPDSSLYYARLAYTSNQKSFEKTWLLETSNLLAKLYKQKKLTDSAFHYQEVAVTLNNNLFGPEKFHRLQLLAINEQQQQQKINQQQKDIQQEKERSENKIKLYSLLTIIGIFLLLAISLYRNNQQKQQANTNLHEQKQKVESALTELKSTQSQLIQREKMASLGELTAGIAHEIRNPLNFVNNFSEVNKELIEEIKIELKTGNTDQAIIIAGEIADNEQKINHHGRRAEAIVNGMLQHSRTTSLQKEPVLINALVNEYLRLSYSGLTAKDTLFNATLQTNFDDSIGKINLIPQEIGRVLLNIFSNAFYAVKQKRIQQRKDYQPMVSVITKNVVDKVEIIVEDNGGGIPSNVLDKIFQPFFTTKPTGQGTGLGLSIAYDVITAHGGEIQVKSKEGHFTQFTIVLPA